VLRVGLFDRFYKPCERVLPFMFLLLMPVQPRGLFLDHRVRPQLRPPALHGIEPLFGRFPLLLGDELCQGLSLRVGLALACVKLHLPDHPDDRQCQDHAPRHGCQDPPSPGRPPQRLHPLCAAREQLGDGRIFLSLELPDLR